MINTSIVLELLGKQIALKENQIFCIKSQLEKYKSILRETSYIDKTAGDKVVYYKHQLYFHSLELKRLSAELKRFL